MVESLLGRESLIWVNGQHSGKKRFHVSIVLLALLQSLDQGFRIRPTQIALRNYAETPVSKSCVTTRKTRNGAETRNAGFEPRHGADKTRLESNRLET